MKGRFFSFDKNWWKSKEARQLDKAKDELEAAKAKLREAEASLGGAGGARRRADARLNSSNALLRMANEQLDRSLDTYVQEIINGWDMHGTKDAMDTYAANVRAKLIKYSEGTSPETLQALLSKIRAVDEGLYRAITSK